MAADSHVGHRIVQWVLRGGLAIAVVLMLAGLAIALVTGQRMAGAVSFADLLAGHSLPDQLIALGLLVLAATPLARVIALVIIWTVQRDRTFALLGLVVVAILAAAIASGYG
ncbi:MAG TPA: DUF1634 domain-containing protein [Kofleriaceae bacterium]